MKVVVEVGQVWRSRDPRDYGKLVTVVEGPDDEWGNGFVVVKSVRRSRMRVSTLRSRYELVQGVKRPMSLTDQDKGELVDDLRYGSSSDLFGTVERIVAEKVAAAKAEALREAASDLAQDWYKNGRHQGHPGCYSDGYERWLRARAHRIGGVA